MRAYRWWEAALVALMVGTFMLGTKKTPGAPKAPAKPPLAQKVPRIIAFTFDDGPSPEYTPQILTLLSRYHAHATFFVLGTEVKHFPGIAKEILKQGSVIANHGYNHVNYFSVGVTGAAHDAQRLTDLLKKEHIPTAPFYRPPFGNSNQKLVSYMAAHGMTLTLWSIDTRDWAMPGTSFITRKVLSLAEPGAIVLMHDSGGNRTETVHALAAVLPVLQAEGYTFVTLPQYIKDLGLHAPAKLPLPAPQPTVPDGGPIE
jgi:peptidoglycan/xylan/chitin deacetylase (PgdA/CDA1 family)